MRAFMSDRGFRDTGHWPASNGAAAEREARTILAETEPRIVGRRQWDDGQVEQTWHWQIVAGQASRDLMGSALADALAAFVANGGIE